VISYIMRIESTFLELRKEAEDLRYGDIEINLKIYEGKIVGFDLLKKIRKFRDYEDKKKIE